MASRRRPVVWSRSARNDLHLAIVFVAEDAPAAGVRLLDRILEATDALSTLSERGRSVRELRGGSIREVLVNPYRIIYRVTPSAVEILAIVHQRREDSFPQLDWLRERQASYAAAS